MAVTLYNLFEAALLCINAIAVLHEERFLVKVGWGRDQSRGFGEEPGVKGQLMNLIHSVRTVMRILGLDMCPVMNFGECICEWICEISCSLDLPECISNHLQAYFRMI